MFRALTRKESALGCLLALHCACDKRSIRAFHSTLPTVQTADEEGLTPASFLPDFIPLQGVGAKKNRGCESESGGISSRWSKKQQRGKGKQTEGGGEGMPNKKLGKEIEILVTAESVEELRNRMERLFRKLIEYVVIPHFFYLLFIA